MGSSTKVVDFSSVKDGGGAFNTKRVPAGDYAAVITKVEDSESKKDQTFQYLFTIKLKKYSQYGYPYYCKLQENQLWKLRNLAVAAGLNVPKKRMKFDPNKIVGKTVGVTMEDDEYDGKAKSVVAAVFPASELAEGEIVDDDDENFDENPQVAGDDEEDEATPVSASDDDDADDEEEKPKKKKGKKGKKKKSSDEDLEQLDISDL